MTPTESYLYLFSDSFFAAIFFLFQKEMAIYVMANGGLYSKTAIYFTAALGSIGGSAINFYIGKWLSFAKNREWFPISQNSMKNAQQQWDKYVVWILLISWLSVIGNPLCFLAGIMRTPLKKFLFIVGVSKASYYLYIVYLAA